MEQKEYVYSPVPSTSPEKEISKKGMELAKKWMEDKGMQLITDKKIYTLKDLPKVGHIPPGTLDRGYLTRFKDPWDFHLILENAADYQLGKQKWEEHFTPPPKSREHKLAFESGLGLFRGMLFMLTNYMNHLSGRDKKGWNWKTGDLVICGVPRKVPSDGIHGYRGVVIKEAARPDFFTLASGPEKNRTGLTVYLLDTGETLVVNKEAEYMAPLPQAFLTFPPLAVPCALHGVSPIGTDWSSLAANAIEQLVSPKYPDRGVQLMLEFYSKKPSKKQEHYHQITLLKCGCRLPRPYFMEVTARVQAIDYRYSYINLSTELIKQDMALAWNPFPHKPLVAKTYFCPHAKDEEDTEVDTNAVSDPIEKEREERSGEPDFKEETERGIILHLYDGKGNPQFGDVNLDQLESEMMDALVACHEHVDGQIIKTNKETNTEDVEGNTVAIMFDELSLQ